MDETKADGDPLVHIYESEVHAIVAEARKFPGTETGGDFYGSFTHGGMPVVWLASGPGPNAKRWENEFNQDPLFTTRWQRHLMKRFGVQYIGGWHSHHTLKLTTPSKGDSETVRGYALRHCRQKNLTVIVNHEETQRVVLRAYYFIDAQNDEWHTASFNVLEGESPIRRLLGTEEREFSSEADWRTGAPHESYRLSAGGGECDPPESLNLPEAEMPAVLYTEVEALRAEGVGVEVERLDNFVKVLVPIGAERFFAAILELGVGAGFKQVNVLDLSSNENINVTDELRRDGIALSLGGTEGGALRNILTFLERRQDEGEV